MPDEVPAGWPPGFAEGPDGRRDLLRLACLRGTTPRTLLRLAWQRGTAHACVEAVRRGTGGSDRDSQWLDRMDPELVLAATTSAGGRFMAFGDPDYPAALEDLHDPPGWLFVRSAERADALRHGAFRVAVVGARRCSAAGRDVAFELGRRLAGAGVPVVSGAAAGIDAASHRGALAAAGPTVAVLGSGIDVAYPASSRTTIEAIARTGAVVSEYPPGTPAEPHHFPARNRIVAALADALVVVEGAMRSGSRISVEHALDLGREVFAVPGPVSSPLSETPLELIRDGATMIRGAEDLMADLGVFERVTKEASPGLPDHERRAYAALVEPRLPEAVARAADLAIPEAVTALVGLELRGLARAAGGRYERTLDRTSTSESSTGPAGLGRPP